VDEMILTDCRKRYVGGGMELEGLVMSLVEIYPRRRASTDQSATTTARNTCSSKTPASRSWLFNIMSGDTSFATKLAMALINEEYIRGQNVLLTSTVQTDRVGPTEGIGASDNA
jgi:hypothetical protein